VSLYLSQVEEGHRVTWVEVVSPAFLTRVEELHVPDLSFAFRKKDQTMKEDSLSSTGTYSSKIPNDYWEG